MTKKPGILIGVLAFLCLAVPLSVFADVPMISGLGLSISYDDVRDKYVFTPSVSIGNSVSPEWITIDMLGVTSSSLTEVSGVLDNLTGDMKFLSVSNLWAAESAVTPGQFNAVHYLSSEKNLPPDGYIIVHAEAYNDDLDADGMSEIFLLSDLRTDNLKNVEVNYTNINMAEFLQEIQLEVTGYFSLGAVVDLTSHHTGTQYSSDDDEVVTVTEDGNIVFLD